VRRTPEVRHSNGVTNGDLQARAVGPVLGTRQTNFNPPLYSADDVRAVTRGGDVDHYSAAHSNRECETRGGAP